MLFFRVGVGVGVIVLEKENEVLFLVEDCKFFLVVGVNVDFFIRVWLCDAGG